ncbi:gamma-glutamyltransferase [Pilobolus umbonatus]|nr:gamma-glutamyltransferase [Pilobolus umbonatus]
MTPYNDEESQWLLNPHKQPTRQRNAAIITMISLIIGCFIYSFLPLTYLISDEDIPHLVVGNEGAVAVELKECSDAGLEILKQGGNAIDSAIASALCIGVVNSFATGNGGFMLIRTSNGTFEYIDFRETAPAASHKDMFVHDPMAAQKGGLSVAVPGEIRGFELAHKRHGVLPWSSLFESAIRISEEGFEVSDLLYSKLQRSKDWIEQSEEFGKVYAPSGEIARPGDIIRRPELGKTLRIIAKEGADVFYEGRLAEYMVNATQAEGGILTMEDMRDYRPVIRPVISSTYHGRKVTTCSAPTSGPVLLSILNIIEAFNFTLDGPTTLNMHRFIEAVKFGFAFRSEIGDPDFIDNGERLQEIISKEWADVVRRNISDNETHGPLYYNPKFEQNDPHGTMHLSIIDKRNNAVSLTSTVNLMFGAKFMDPITGIIMNDEMDDFSIPGIPNNFGLYPSIYNYAGPGKRPLSTITPVIIENENNELEMSLGGSGGSQILTATLNVILNTYDFGADIFQAVKAPRIHHQLIPNEIGFEEGYNVTLLRELEAKGHKVGLGLTKS